MESTASFGEGRAVKPAREPRESVFSTADTTVVKGAAILMMLMCHLFAHPDRLPDKGYLTVMPYWPFNRTIEEQLAFFGGLCVAVYLFLSGYGLTRSAESRPVSTWRYAGRKAWDFYRMYWAAFVLFMVPAMLLAPAKLGVYDWKTVVLTVVGWNAWINGEWWFVRVYLLLIALFAPMLWLMTRNCGALIVAISLVYLVSYRLGPFEKLAWFLPAFVAGMAFAHFRVYEALPSVFPQRAGIWAIGGACFTVMLLHRRISVPLTGAVYAPFIAFWVSRLDVSAARDVLAVLGRYSFPIWLCHSFFCYYYFKDLVYWPRVSIVILVWLLALSMISALVIGFLSHLLQEGARRLESGLWMAGPSLRRLQQHE